MVFGIAAIGFYWCSAALQAQEATGRVFVNVLAPDKSVKDRPFTASAVCDGRIVFQQDGSLDSPPNKDSVSLDKLPLGMCDFRVECEGMLTEVKRGVQVFERDRIVEMVLKPGEGVHIVELAVGGLAREEVAARLRALEEGLEKLKEKVNSLPQPHQE